MCLHHAPKYRECDCVFVSECKFGSMSSLKVRTLPPHLQAPSLQFTEHLYIFRVCTREPGGLTMREQEIDDLLLPWLLHRLTNKLRKKFSTLGEKHVFNAKLLLWQEKMRCITGLGNTFTSLCSFQPYAPITGRMMQLIILRQVVFKNVERK